MLEIKISLEAIDLTKAINTLAAAIAKEPIITHIDVPTPISTIPNTDAPTSIVPTSVTGVPLAQVPQYTKEQIMTAGASLMDAGKLTELLNLLHSFGVKAVTDIPQDQLGAFATKLRELGADI